MNHVIVVLMGETDSGRRISVDRDAGGFRLETADNRDSYIADGLIDLDLTLHDFYNLAEAADHAYRALTAQPVLALVAVAEQIDVPLPTTPRGKRGADRKLLGTTNRAVIGALAAQGKTLTEIVAATGIAKTTVYGHLKAIREEAPLTPASPFPGNGNGNGAHA